MHGLRSILAVSGISGRGLIMIHGKLAGIATITMGS